LEDLSPECRALNDEIRALITDFMELPSPFHSEDTARKHWLCARKMALTGIWPCWCLDLGLPSLKHCEK